MKRNRQLFFCIYFPMIFGTSLFFNTQVSAQKSALDSLIHLVQTDKADTTKLFHLAKLTNTYNGLSRFDSTIILCKASIELATEIAKKSSNTIEVKTAKKYLSTAYYSIGMVDYRRGNYSEAMEQYKISINIGSEIRDTFCIARSYNSIGLVYYMMGNYASAIENYLKALKYFEEIGFKSGLGSAYSNIGLVYLVQRKFDNAKEKFNVALQIYLSLNDERGISNCYNNLGRLYFEQENFTDAETNHLAALRIREKLGDKYSMAVSYNNLAMVYANTENYSEALKYDFMAIEIRKALHDRSGLATSYYNVGDVNMKQKKYEKAREYFGKVQVLATEMGLKEWLKDIYLCYSLIDSASGNYKGAFENHKLYIQYRDSIDNEETRKKTIQTQMTYEFEKKEAVDKAEHKKELENQKLLSEEKSRKQRIVIGFVVFGLLLVVGFAGFIFRTLRVTRKQKSFIESQKSYVEEKQKEIVDSIHYAKRIQTSLLPTEMYIGKNLNRLNKS